jgi:glycine dehydrogenase subunit 1
MRYIPNDRKARERMLADVSLGSPEELFEPIPAEYRLNRPLDLPEPIDEAALAAHMAALAGANASSDRRACVIGGGAYDHYIPSVVRHMTGRSEFYTAYTPYQPEISQGTLQAIFEYQTMITGLTGMDVSNASLYDGASAAAEAVLMAVRVTGVDRVVVSRGVNPRYRETIRTYLQHSRCAIVEAGLDPASGRTDLAAAARLLEEPAACFVVQSPNFLGVVEDPGGLAALRRAGKALLAAVVTEPLSLGMLTPPGEWGADLVAAEGQSFGIPVGFGGPYLGILAVREEYVRQMPGRLVGQTVDARGERGFVLTLATREQHIRREKATSNVCSNEGLCALAAAIYLSTLGPGGLRRLAARNMLTADAARRSMAASGAWHLPLSGPVFNEFVAVPKGGAEAAQKRLREAGFSGGLRIADAYPEYPEGLLFCFTEKITDEALGRFNAAAGGAR